MMQQQKSSDGHGKTYGSGQDKELAAPLTKCLPPGNPASKKPRKNGWQRPWNLSLVCLLVIPIIMAVAFLGSFPLCIPFVWRPATYVIFTSLFLIFFINFLISASINAAEPNVANFWGKKKPKIFPKNQSATSTGPHLTIGGIAGKGNTAVVRNNYCYICDAYVGLGAKHCGQCNKCVEKFDHHCTWLNNCVGHRNYRYFIFALVSGILLLLIVVGASSTMILVAAFDPKTLKKWIASNANTYNPNYNSSEDSIEDGRLDAVILDAVVPSAVFYVFHSVLLVVAAVVLCFTVHLLIFHIYLNYKSMTTYDYIVRQRRLQQQQQQTKAPSTAPPSSRETEHESAKQLESTAGAATNLKLPVVSNITDNPAYDDFSEVGEEVDVLDSIHQVKSHEVDGASDGMKYHNDERCSPKLKGVEKDQAAEKDLMGFEAADGLSYCGSEGSSSNHGSSYVVEGAVSVPGKENAGQGGIMVSASAYFRTESLLSASESTTPKSGAVDRREAKGGRGIHRLSGVEGDDLREDKAAVSSPPLSEDETLHKQDQEELLPEISVHDTYSGTLRFNPVKCNRIGEPRLILAAICSWG